MPGWQSIRFRLSVQYSALVFGLGGGLLGLVYLATQRWLRSQTMMHTVMTQRVVRVGDNVVFMPELKDVEVRVIESIYNEIVLERVAQFTLLALGLLFLLSLVVGWIMSGRVLRPVGEITGVAREIQASDLSRRIDLTGPDDELKRLGDTFDQMLDRLEAAFDSQRQFLADTSHDLRTPLTVIRSNVEILEGDPNADVEDWRGAGAVIRRNAERMSEMIQGLLASARLQAQSSEAVAVSLDELVLAKISDLAPVADEHNVSLGASTAPVVVSGVEIALDRALSNLIDNALKVAPAGSAVTVANGMHAGWGFMAVADHGPGLPDETDRLGLGLTIVEQIAQGHGGKLAAFPNEPSGTVMVVWLPLDDTSESSSPPDRPPFTPI